MKSIDGFNGKEEITAINNMLNIAGATSEKLNIADVRNRIDRSGHKLRTLKDRIFFIYIIIGSAIITVPLFYILYYITKMGISAINFNFLTTLPNPAGEPGGGIINAITGTLLLLLLAGTFSIVPSVLLGIYLAEHKRGGVAKYAKIGIDVLQGVPSIVIGIVVYMWIVKPMGGFNAFSGGIALALMMIPVIAKSTEETIRLVPNKLKEASIALGVPYYKTIIKVIIPAGMSGIVTGILLAIARVSGETAPLLFTAFGSPFINWNILKPVDSLPLLIFNYAGSPYQDWHTIAWGASFLLVAFILILNILTKIITRRWKVHY